MPRYRVTLDIDGIDDEEVIVADDAVLAGKKALKMHPTHVTGVIPLDEQLSIPADQTTIDDAEAAAEAGEDAVAELDEEAEGLEDDDDTPLTPEEEAELKRAEADIERDLAGADLNNEGSISSYIDPDAAEAELEAMRGEDVALDDLTPSGDLA